MLLKVIEVFFVDNSTIDSTVIDAKPVSSLEFRWLPDAPDAILRRFDDLPFPVDLVSRVLASYCLRSGMAGAGAVNEVGSYMYHAALAAKKPVGRKDHVTKVDKMADSLVSSLSLLLACFSGCYWDAIRILFRVDNPCRIAKGLKQSQVVGYSRSRSQSI